MITEKSPATAPVARLAFLGLLLCGMVAAAATPSSGEFHDRWWPAVSKPHTQVTLSAELDEIIDRVLVEEGDRVEEGQKVLEFDSGVIDAQIQVAEVEADYKARIETARVRHKFLAEEYQRRARMGEFMSTSKKKEAKNKMEEAELNIKELKRKKEAARAQLQYYRAQARQYTLNSPIAGVVSEVKVEPGEMARVGTPLIRIVDPTAIEVPARLPERYLHAVEAGQRVQVRFIHADADPFTGRVETILPVVDSSSGTLTAKVLVELKTREVVPGMECEVRFRPTETAEKETPQG